MALLFLSTLDDPRSWREALVGHDPELDYRVWPDMGDARDIEAALVWHPPAGLLASLPNLKLIQSLGAGIDHLLGDPELPQGVPLARLVDPELTRQMVEYVCLAVMSRQRRIDRYRQDQAARRWKPEIPLRPDQCRVSVLGLGEIGGAAAEDLARRGYAVAGWSRSPRTLAGVETFHGRQGLAGLLARTDILVCMLPLTPETEDLLNRALFEALPEGAYVINVGRGGQLVEADLLAAIDSGHLAGAWLDVFRTEPLPEDHGFWSHPAITVTPHIAGWTVPDSAAALVVENMRRVQAGKAPHHKVTLDHGY